MEILTLSVYLATKWRFYSKPDKESKEIHKKIILTIFSLKIEFLFPRSKIKLQTNINALIKKFESIKIPTQNLSLSDLLLLSLIL